MIALCCQRLHCERDCLPHGRSAVAGVDAEFEEAMLHAVTGEPGSGKSLLLHLLGLLYPPDAGEVVVFGKRTSSLSNEERGAVRNALFGYLFPAPCLLPAFTVAENVAMPLFRFSAADPEQAEARVHEVLAFFGIDHLREDLADGLDIETQQVVAFARALVHRPRVVIAVTPRSFGHLLPFARRAVDQLGITCLWGAAPETVEPACNRLLRLASGRVVADQYSLP
jgi:lipoprotein-releasing system ATP-binding protein